MRKIITLSILLISFISCKDSLKEFGREMTTETRLEIEAKALKNLCSNSEVKNIIISSIKEEMIVNLTMHKMEGDLNFASLFLEPLQQYSETDLSETLRNKMESEIRKYLNEQHTKLDPNEIQIVKESISQVDNNFKNINGTRPTAIDEELKTCDCKGNLELQNGYDYSFEYSVQETDTHFFTELYGFSQTHFQDLVNYMDLEKKESKLSIGEKKVENIYSSKSKQDTTPLEGEGFSSQVKEGIYLVNVEKAYFHTEPNLKSKRKSYLIKGDKIRITEFHKDHIFGYGSYRNGKGTESSGWLKMSDLSVQQEQNFTYNTILKYRNENNEPILVETIPTDVEVKVNSNKVSVNLGFGDIDYLVDFQERDLENSEIVYYNCYSKEDKNDKYLIALRPNDISVITDSQMLIFTSK